MSTTMTKVRGVFHDRDGLNQAIYDLGRLNVPSDSIHVYVVDGNGRPKRQIPVVQERGALRGALMGAVGGACVGALIAALAPEAFGIRPIPFDWDSWLAAGMLVVTMALAGVSFGIAFRMGRWRVRNRASDDELERGAAWVEVESDELAESSREALEQAGAEQVSTS